MTKKKCIYWHLIIEVDPRNPNKHHKVGNVLGLDEITEKQYWYSDEIKGFFPMNKLQYLGRTPKNLHIENPGLVSAKIEQWKKLVGFKE